LSNVITSGAASLGFAKPPSDLGYMDIVIFQRILHVVSEQMVIVVHGASLLPYYKGTGKSLSRHIQGDAIIKLSKK